MFKYYIKHAQKKKKADTLIQYEKNCFLDFSLSLNISSP